MDALAGAAWELLGTGPGRIAAPAELDAYDGTWLPAEVPGTVAGALRSAHGLPVALGTDIDGQDWWWRTRVTAQGAHLLIAEGLATIADVWLDGEQVLHSRNMFRSSVVEVPALSGATEIVIRCSAPMAVLGKQPRPRWKTTLVPEQRWRFLRTTMLGRVPTWAGTAAPAGPWRPLRLEPLDSPVIARRRVASRVDGSGGALDVELEVRGAVGSATVRCHGFEAAMHRDADGLLRCTLRLPEVERWWPHSHGDQPRYEVGVSFDDGQQRSLSHVGFRTVELDTSSGGDGRLRLNDVDVFARGACWNSLDTVGLQSDEGALRSAISAAREAGHNIIRVQGSWVYECDAFYALCDELGMMVWQDCMLTALDLPRTQEFTAELSAEVAELADRLAGRPCVAVVCGGAETEQQPAMLGLTLQDIPAITQTIPAILADLLPEVAYVTATPSGGRLPMTASTGIAQYFGVGAYLAPLQDVRAARVRFAAESLAFSIPPESDALLRAFGSARVAGHDPRWKATVPRDVAASWDFEDVRDHYVRHLFGVDPMHVRYADPERYLDLGRAAVCIAMTEVMTWWRRPASECAGGIVLSMRDQVMGAGWGLLDGKGRGKAPWFALRPVLAPLALLVSDDGADGVTIIAVNDGPEPLGATLEVRTWSESGAVVDEGGQELGLPAHGAVEVGLDSVLGRFTDSSGYYRFGPRQRDLLHIRLRGTDGTLLTSRTVEFGHHLRPAVVGGVEAVARAAEDGWVLDVVARRPVHWLAVDSVTHEPRDSWFHLAPGERRVVPLTPVDGSEVEPRVALRGLDLAESTVAVETAPNATGSTGADPATERATCGIIEGWA